MLANLRSMPRPWFGQILTFSASLVSTSTEKKKTAMLPCFAVHGGQFGIKLGSIRMEAAAGARGEDKNFHLALT